MHGRGHGNAGRGSHDRFIYANFSQNTKEIWKISARKVPFVQDSTEFSRWWGDDYGIIGPIITFSWMWVAGAILDHLAVNLHLLVIK